MTQPSLGRDAQANIMTTSAPALTAEDYVKGVLQGDRTLLARAITLIESNSPRHSRLAQEVVSGILPHTGKSNRVGITGVPGVGKSTFIEALGTRLCEAGNRVAVLAVDPTSSVSGGSILGDKTRMENLSRHANSFIRPSPSSGALGGVGRKSRETILLCEAAGYNIVLVETVGVGQSETLVHSMVDCFVVLMLAGAGDELQGMKKGIMELADILVMTKADGDNRLRAEQAASDLRMAARMLTSTTPGWEPPVLLTSSMEGTGIGEVWETVESYRELAAGSGFLEEKRRHQNGEWLRAMVSEELNRMFYQHPSVLRRWPETLKLVEQGKLPLLLALERLKQAFEEPKSAMD
ncbi:MAG: methylmalonyl Co-A mutase-associated GTPase MeaB [Methylacidiphilales bacterium]|nr:methylmalonyl Co-A mutase-associated GTPase MeaB [Candidatus Methylacidiphilales bacterium]